ncbi:MAG: PD-(D/E)XK nuclease family protein, partial [Gemmatimonadota bacterium]
DWIELTRQITGGSKFGFRERLCRVVGERYDVVRLDQRAVSLLDSLLHEWKGLVRGGSRFPASEWHDRLRRLLQANELALTTPVQEGVQILEAHEAALTPFSHVFLLHANDGEFPRPVQGGGVFSERESLALRRSGLPLEDRALGLRRERSLWRAVTAGCSVTVTYRTATSAGVPLLPSLMVPKHEAAITLSEIAPGSELPEAISPAEQRTRDVLAVARKRRGGKQSVIKVVDVHSVRHAVLAAFAEELRAGSLDALPGIEEALRLPAGLARPVSECAHAYAGWLRDPVVLASLTESFGPDYVWSASQLEQYAVRPFDFLLGRILHINDRSEVEEDTGPLASGTIVHAVLEALHRRFLESGSESLAGIEPQLEEVCRDVFDKVEQEADLWLGVPSIWRLRREHIREVIRGFVNWDVRSLEKMKARPIAVEHEFGSDESARVRLEGLDICRQPAELLLAGRIDRVDRTESGGLRIIDYKLNKPPANGRLKDGALLQSALYMRAWEHVSGTAVDEALFLSVRHPGQGSRSGLSAKQVDDVLPFALSIPARVRAGLFEPVQAKSVSKISFWQAGRDVTRTERVLRSGNRFEPPDERAFCHD